MSGLNFGDFRWWWFYKENVDSCKHVIEKKNTVQESLRGKRMAMTWPLREPEEALS